MPHPSSFYRCVPPNNMCRNPFYCNYLYNRVMCFDKFRPAPSQNNPDPNIVNDPPMLVDPAAFAVFNNNNPAFNINTAPRCTLMV